MAKPFGLVKTWVVLHKGTRYRKRVRLWGTRDGRYRVGVRFGMFWVAWPVARCRKAGCYDGLLGCGCRPLQLPGGVAGEGFRSRAAVGRALATHYSKRGW